MITKRRTGTAFGFMGMVIGFRQALAHVNITEKQLSV